MADQIQFGSHTVELSSLDKMYFPGISKREFIDYYQRIAETMLPYLVDRPVTMQRFPNGLEGEGFFQQNVSDYFPDWIKTATVDKEDGQTTHVLINNAATLVYLANQGCITPHVWLSRVDKLDYPDRMILDLDPSVSDDVESVRTAARLARDLLEELDLIPFIMTTGSSGFHLVVPLDRSQPFDVVRAFAQDAADLLAARYPEQLTTERLKKKRGKRIYLDTLRNSYAHTGVPPYGVRPKPTAPVAAPIEWDELTSDLYPQRYTIQNIFRRLAQKSDPWLHMAEHVCSLDAAQPRLAEMLASEQRSGAD